MADSSAYSTAYSYSTLRQRLLEDDDICETDPEDHCVDVLRVSSDDTSSDRCTTAGELSRVLQGSQHAQDQVQIVLLHQEHSQYMISIGQEMIALLLDHFRVMPEFLEVVSNFRFREESTEEGYCSPCRIRRSPNDVELTYVYKYSEYKGADAKTPWVIRQTAVWHRYSYARRTSVAIVLSPHEDSLYERSLKSLLHEPVVRSQYVESPLLLHAKLISTYLHKWKDYLEHHEKGILKESTTAMNVDTRPTSIAPTLQSIHQIRRHLIPVDTILSSTELLCGQLRDLDKELHARAAVPPQNQPDSFASVFTSFFVEAGAFKGDVLYLTRRAAQVSQLISDTLNLRNQQIARKDSVTIRVITLITLFYLPSSFIATLLGSNLIDFDTETRNIIVSHQFWLFFVIALPLTGLTILGWWTWVTWNHRVEQFSRWGRAVNAWAMSLRHPAKKTRKTSMEMSPI